MNQLFSKNAPSNVRSVSLMKCDPESNRQVWDYDARRRRKRLPIMEKSGNDGCAIKYTSQKRNQSNNKDQ